jgi:hypothetical protein
VQVAAQPVLEEEPSQQPHNLQQNYVPFILVEMIEDLVLNGD